jgi:hypothetical protein
VDRVIKPSDVAVPLATSRRFDPLSVVGSSIDWTSVPLGEYSSRKTGRAVAHAVDHDVA